MSSAKQIKNLQISEDGITYKKNNYSFHDIRHIFFARMRTTQRMNFVKVGEPETVGLSLTMTDGIDIEVSSDERSIFIGLNKNRKDEIKDIIGLYMYLSQITFSNRLLFYEEQIQRQGYFEIGECRFYPSDRVTFRDKEFPVNTTRFLKGYGTIELRKKDYRWTDRLKRELGIGKIPLFLTLTDTDVVFYMLEKYFGLTWE